MHRIHRGNPLSLVLAVLAAAALPAPAVAAATGAAMPAAGLHSWERGNDPAALDAWVHEHLRRADADVARLVAVAGAHTVANTLRPYDDAFNELMLATSQSNVLYGVGATKELRDKAQALTQTANAALTALNLNPAVYRALAAVPRRRTRGRVTTWTARCSSTAWRVWTRTRRRGRRSRPCRTRSPSSVLPSNAPCTMTCARWSPTRRSSTGCRRTILPRTRPMRRATSTSPPIRPTAAPARKFSNSAGVAPEAVPGRRASRLSGERRDSARAARGGARSSHSCSATPPGRTLRWPTR